MENKEVINVICDEIATKEDMKNKSWLSLPRQIILFLIGWGGFSFLASIMVSIAMRICDTTTVTATSSAISLTSTYSLLLIFLIIPCIPYLKSEFFSKMKDYKNYLFGIACGFVLVVFSIAYNNIIAMLGFVEENSNQAGIESVVVVYPIISIIIVGIVGPICEELTYRVGFFNSLLRKNRLLAYALCALLFGLIHFDFGAKDLIIELVNLPNYIVAGIILCFAYDKFGLAGSISAHVFNNLYSVITTIILTNLL